MGFMDNFTSDSPVTVKQPDYYEMVKEAAKAELITNAVNAEVPGYYIQAMITGKKPDFLNTMDAEEEETGFRTEYEQITGAVVSIFEAWEKENGVESAADGLHRLIDDLSKNRIEELRVIRENREAENAILSKLLIPPLCGDESRAEETESEGTQHCLKVWCTRPLNSKQICQRRKRREKQARHNQTSTIRTQDGI